MKEDAKKDTSNIGKALMNKGTIGRWQQKLSKEHSARMDRRSKARFEDTGSELDYGNDEEFAKQFYDRCRI